MRVRTAAEIAEHVGGELVGDGSTPLQGFAPASSAQPGDLTFAENERYFQQAEQSAASAILVDGRFRHSSKVLICVQKPRVAFARVLPLFFPEPVFPAGIHATAVVAPSAQVDPTAYVGPFCVLNEHVRIGSGAVLEGHNFIGSHSEVGPASHLFPQVTLYSGCKLGSRVRVHSGTVLGSDGFGYVLDGAEHRKVPQIGNVLIGDDVEIGANVTVDRGALGPTMIGRGTKIDNLVQIAHNVVIGEHCLIIAQAGIAGSSKLGNYVTLAGQSGVAGHVQIGDRAILAGQSGAMYNMPPGTKWLGSPAHPDRQAKRQFLAMIQLPDLIKRVQELEKKLERMDGRDQ